MSYREKIHEARALLKEAQREAERAGDYATADELGYAIACGRSAEIMAEGFGLVRHGRGSPK